MMNRRQFVQHMIWGMGSLVMMRPLAPLTVMGATDNIGGKPLHYIPLNGRLLRDMAQKKQHHGNGLFLNPVGLPRGGRFKELLRWKFSRNAYEKEMGAQTVTPVDIDWAPVNNHNGLSITFLKHASLVIKDHDQTYYVDPVFNDIGFFIKDYSPIRFDLNLMPRANHVLITHGHYDHLNESSLKHFEPGTHVISPLGYKGVFKNLGMNNRTQLDWYETYETRRGRITLIPCNHWTMRNPLVGSNRSLWGSYIIETQKGYTIYIAGDTAYFDGFEQIGNQFNIDLAIFNLGAYEPRWFMAQSHMNPMETVRAFQELKAKRLMIVHWGTFRLGDEPVHFPPRDLKKVLEKAALRDRLVDVKHGNTTFVT